MGNGAPNATFFDVFEAEVEAVNARRRRFAADAAEPETWRVTLACRVPRDERDHVVAIPVDPQPLVGVALSGGGVRSAAYCLGVLQGLDAVKDDDLPQVLDAVDYLSTVSGGGYIGASLVAGCLYTQGVFPFASKLNQEETIETQHIRDYSNYLAPQGAVDVLVGVVVLVRGLLINAMIFLGVILLAAFITVAINPTEAKLGAPAFGFSLGDNTRFPMSATALALLLAMQILYSMFVTRFRRAWIGTLPEREWVGRSFVVLLALLAVVGVSEAQRYVLTALCDAYHLTYLPYTQSPPAGWLGRKIAQFGGSLHTVFYALVAAATTMVTFGDKLVSVARATVGDSSWSGAIKHVVSQAVVYVAALVAPLLLWFTYLAFCFWGIEIRPDYPQTPHSLLWLARLGADQPHFVWLYLIATIILLALSACVTPNASSLHIYYRDRLSRAFLWQPDKLKKDILRREAEPRWLADAWSGVRNWLTRRGAPPASVDTLRLSQLKPRGAAGELDPRSFAPFPLINTSVNLEGSKYLNRRGRNADSFFFSPLHVGSEATGFVATQELEAVDPDMNVATAMAISGAAASANMGASTIRALTFSLAALNVRLGYWLYNPRRVPQWNGRAPHAAKIGPYYFVLETLGQLNEWRKNVYLTDGGHFDNLGLYELLKRRCKVIVVADAEADPPLNFESLVRLQRYARIDLGVLIDLPWEELRRFNQLITVDAPHGPTGSPTDCIGPHIALGRIQYGPDETGVLIYIKACLSGDESDLIRDYRRRNPEFPHETTLDQFFTEEQFEVYRALGFHATESFFVGRDRFAVTPPSPDFPDWPETVEQALRRLNLSDNAIELIVERQRHGE